MQPNKVKSSPLFDPSQFYVQPSYGSSPSTLKVGTYSGPNTLDPVDSWDSDSYAVMDQVVETLFSYDLNDPELPLINQLAESYFWINSTALHVTVRQGILFHDYTPFNAAAAKWNFDRLLYLTNCTGTNFDIVAYTHSLWKFPNTNIPIISHVETFGEWDLVINLNAPYGPLLHLLSFINAGMVSPSSTPPNELVGISTGILVGTGPFTFDYYTPEIEVKFTRWDSYWKAPAYFEEMVYSIFDDLVTAHVVFLAGDIDILKSFSDQELGTYEADPEITLKKFTEDTGKTGFVYNYISINNEKYNQTWRKVMSHAINYSYIIEILRYGNGVKANTPISPGFGAAYNENAIAPNFNITEARALMQSMGFGVGFTTDYEWREQAAYEPFLTVTYQYILGSSFRENLGFAITEWFEQIGIAVIMEPLTWDDFLYYLIIDPDLLDLVYLAWAPDYPEPYNMLDPLFNPLSYTNSAQVYDGTLLTMMASVLEETDETVRYNIYKDIQEYLAEVGFFHIPLYHDIVNFVHLNEIQGVPYNALKRFYAYPIYRANPGSFTLSTDAGSPDDDGDFTLYWSLSDNADKYSVYQSSSFIDNLDGSQTKIAEGITDLSLSLSQYPEGTYFFIVAAYNEYGYTLSNCINIVVDITEDHDLKVFLDIPSGIEINDTYLITASVKNVGLNDETNVGLELYLEGTLVDSLNIPFLPIGDIQYLYYEWTPTEYKMYSFEAYAPPINGETFLNDNYLKIDVPVLETQIFDGLFIEYVFDQMGYGFETNFTYTPYQDGLFYETWNIYGMSSYQWILDPSTRIMSNNSVFGDGFHTPIWIFTDVNLGDIIPIAVDGEGDHPFNVTDEFIYELPGFGAVEVWLLEDLTYPRAYAWYEKSTGILLNGLFCYWDGIYNYTLEFFNTNAQFNYVNPPGPFTLSSDADNPDVDGAFTLFWTESESATSYSIYLSDTDITEITPDLSLIAEEVTGLDFALEGYADGTYYFAVVAHNEDGSTLSNCIQVNVDLELPPVIMYDSIPDESILTYTRASQVIGSVTAYSTSQIIFVGFVGGSNPGFALDTSITEFENGEAFLSETLLMTTNQLQSGVHVLTLRFYCSGGLYIDKTFNITVYRQAELNLRGEFDYLLRERIRISIVAQAFDLEDKFPLNPTLTGMTVHIKIADYDGNIKVEETMTYNPDGYFHWNSTDTIKNLFETFTEAIYIVQAWIEFHEDSYYIGGVDIIEFHIDPPGEDAINPWFTFMSMGLIGLVGVNITVGILLKRSRRAKRLA